MFEVLEIIVGEELVQIQFGLQRGLLLQKLSPAEVSSEDFFFFFLIRKQRKFVFS